MAESQVCIVLEVYYKYGICLCWCLLCMLSKILDELAASAACKEAWIAGPQAYIGAPNLTHLQDRHIIMDRY